MSQLVQNFTAAEEVDFAAAGLVAAFAAQVTDARTDRTEAIACYLATAPGWQEARDSLGGAFAEEGHELRLRRRKSP